MIILKTSPYYEDWIASHYELSVSDRFNFQFGDTGRVSPEYHDAILQRIPIKFCELSASNIVDILKQYLSSGYYINIYIKLFPGIVKGKERYHEVVFCGFDDEKQTFSVVRFWDSSLQIVEYGYDYIHETCPDFLSYMIIDDNLGIDLSLEFQYPATAFKLNPYFEPSNCAYGAYHKLKNELYGGTYCNYGSLELDKYNETSVIDQGYRGIYCLYAFEKMLKMEIEGEEFPDMFRGITSATKKICEHQLLIIRSMEYVIKKWNKAINKEAETCLQNYKLTYETVNTWLGLILKYNMTHDKAILQRIIAKIPTVFIKERQCLESFVNKGINWKIFNRQIL